MCLGIPGQVVRMLEGYHGQLALVDVAGAERKVNIGMLEDQRLEPRDWVLIHMGFAVERTDAAGAAKAMAGLEMMGRPRDTRVRRRFRVSGLVQGVGFRPFVYVTARDLNLTGSVINDSSGVIAEVEGAPGAVDEFARRLRDDAPTLAVVESVDATDIDTLGGTDFVIGDSTASEGARTLASPDMAMCDDCRRELMDPDDARYRHPFITCTNCGPRFTIIKDLPYDRPKTTMAGFPLCQTCAAEYADPTDRRFHAQPIACPGCGPRLEFVDGDGIATTGDAACLALTRSGLAAGAILAIKGLGGYHLACDATNADAVAELRRRKQRGDKPFAVMVADLSTARELAHVSEPEAALLIDLRRPIVLLRSLDATTLRVAPGVAPANPDLGIMLPYTPLHVLLFGLAGDAEGPRVLVMTSGNRGGEPIVYDDAQAADRLGPLVDGWLRHDRPIEVPCDDSVARVVAAAELPIRRSRGYAPMPIALPFDVPATLAVGADLKNTCGVAEGRYAWLSQHVGDMDDLATVEAFGATEQHLEALTRITPESVACDAHPGYRSTAWARSHADGRPVKTVQHHHAHIASVMGEHGLDGTRQVIGFAFDGTGYGPDGAIWGGEVLIADYKGFRRFAHLAYVPLAGGDASVQRPYRMALSHLRAAGIPWDDDLAPVDACPPDELSVLAHQLGTGFGCVPTSSMGRFFDAVSSIVGVQHKADFEAEAAIRLESVARAALATADLDSLGRYLFRLPSGQDPAVGMADVVRCVTADVRSGRPIGEIALMFHLSVAHLIVELATCARSELGLETVILGGGVFQNSLLLGAAKAELEDCEFKVLIPRQLPPNDGGLALGQILVAATR